MQDIRDLIQEILKEEISSRSVKTTLPPEDSMFNWLKFSGVKVEISLSAAHGVWTVSILDEKRNEKTSKHFKDENEARMFARIKAEEIQRKNQAEKEYPSNSIRY